MIFPTDIRVGRRGVPKFTVGNLQHPPHEFLTRFLSYRKWSVIEQTDSVIRVIVDGKVELELTLSAWTAVFSEWVYWKNQYIEFMPETTRTVLDVGAGCGETALLYLLHGASKVICVEPDPNRAQLLERNGDRNHWDISIVRQEFDTRLLKQYDFDFMKMDCEGCERLLVNVNSLPPCVMEIHGRELLGALTAHFPHLKFAKLQSGARFDRWILGSSSRSGLQG